MSRLWVDGGQENALDVHSWFCWMKIGETESHNIDMEIVGTTVFLP